MTVDEFLANPEVLRSIYGDLPWLGDDFRVRSINLNWRGPTVIMRTDLPHFPDSVPQDWSKGGADTMQCHLQFLAVENISVRKWEPPVIARIQVASREGGRRIDVSLKGDGIDVDFSCSDSVLVGRVSAFKSHHDGSDGGSRSFVSRIDARRYSSLPGTDEKTYYGRI
ncbi:Imm50 family immunity protein [Streptomyces sp. MMG1533]|uniref:Imm50 family immunity protein n=1 Tax=Streptomyces sp. MMG1533 TaxID=1415546 RepID=UPI00131DDDDA